MAYTKKAKYISKYQADLVVDPECEYFGEIANKNLWFGDNRKKGIGIFSYSDYELELHEEYNSDLKYIIPIKVKGLSEFNLFAIWAMNDTKDMRKRYIGQIYLAINYYKDLFYKPTVIIGDFNWNVIWDVKPDYPLHGTLRDVIGILKNWNIRSAYHEFFNEDFGRETKPTLYLYHSQDRPYHVDYCFASSDLGLRNFEVGNFTE